MLTHVLNGKQGLALVGRDFDQASSSGGLEENIRRKCSDADMSNDSKQNKAIVQQLLNYCPQSRPFGVPTRQRPPPAFCD
jgi:hypothetical protein